MACAFITGIPAAGKSWLARRVAERTGALHVGLDDLRAGMMDDPALRPWARFYLDRDEREHWRTTTHEDHWRNLVAQSKAFWPRFQARINEVRRAGTEAVFESVCLLPNLLAQEPDLKGICLLAPSREVVAFRNRVAPRWGTEKDLQAMEVDFIWSCERPRYEEEATRHGIPVFADAHAAETALVRLISS